jgi:hypothetical protein
VSARRLALALITALALLAGAAAQARGERVVAIGDVHGAYEPLLALLSAAGITDARGRWTGGDATLVQLGDLLDRGPDERRVLDLLMRLEREADAQDGRVIVVLGNHEIMAMQDDWRYASPAAIEAFGGAAARRAALARTGKYGRWLRRRPALAEVDGTVFLHGGISPEVATIDAGRIRARVREELARYDAARAKAIRERTLAEDAGVGALLALGLPQLATYRNWLISHSEGPFWFRGYDQWSDEDLAKHLPQILARLGATRLVVGHSVQLGGVRVRAGGKVLLIDTGMLGPPFYPGGAASALEIRDGRLSVINANGERAALAGLARE